MRSDSQSKSGRYGESYRLPPPSRGGEGHITLGWASLLRECGDSARNDWRNGAQ